MLLTGRVRRREGADRGNGSPGDHSRPFLLGLPPGAPASARFPLALGTNAAWAVRSEGPAALKPGHTFHTPGKHHRRRFSAPSRRPPTRRPFAWCLQLRALRPHRPHQAGPQGSPQLSCTLALPSLPAPPQLCASGSILGPQGKDDAPGVGAGWLHLFPGLCPSGLHVLSFISDAFKLLF